MPKKAATPPPATAALGVEMLAPDPVNPRKIDAAKLRGLGYAMTEFGDLSGIVWNERTGLLVAGHQRMHELIAAGASTWQRLDKTSGVIIHPKTGERFPIRIVDWEIQRAHAALLVANNPHLQGEFTAGAVDLLTSLEDEKDFAELELSALLDDLRPDADPEEDGPGHPGLEEFDIRPAAKPTWILIAAPSDAAAEIESDLRGRYAGDEGIRIEVANANRQ
jgi:hypothetical protein